LVFSRTKHGANNLAKKLIKENIKAAAIHGNKSQAQRTKALHDFKQGGVQVLVATDIAARGIDIEQLARVINFDLPHVPEDYVHRIGRTGRAGATGLAISLVSGEEGKQLRDIERLIKFAVPRGDSEEYAFALANPAPASKSSEPSRRPANNQRPRGRQGAAAGKPGNKGSANNKWKSSRSKAAA
jgi:ATP-dependent RNA helicase RhlE